MSNKLFNVFCETRIRRGLEVKLSLTFKSRGHLIDKLKLLLREAYTGEQTQGERDDVEDDLNEENDF